VYVAALGRAFTHAGLTCACPADKSQADRIQEQLAAASSLAAAVQVSTVDAFQGAERDVILLSSVRTRAVPNDFVDSPRRINVAISRARR
jgi:superfamily I DNA and/or RNA helicase